MKVNVVSRKLIKPCTPTPQNKYKLSFLDEVSPPMNVSLILFYPPNPNPKPILITHLEESLAKILPQFYPFAGRYIKKDRTIDRCDEGAEFVVAEAIEVEPMADFIANTKNDQFLNNLLSRQPHEADKATDPILSIQITEFKSCGGLAISISVSHRIADASSIGTFVAAFSNIANLNSNFHAGQWQKIMTNNNNINPSFDAPKLFPGRYLSNDNIEPPSNIVVKRLLLNKNAISSLRSKLRSKNGGVVLSRVRVVSAVIAKALIGVDRAKHEKSRACIILQGVNMRDRTIPPLPHHSCGNFSLHAVTELANKGTDLGLQEMVYLLGDGIDKVIDDCAKMLSLDEDGREDIILGPIARALERLKSGEISYILGISDWSKFGFYEADFGLGRPVWVGVGTLPCPNMTILMDNKEGDGIEAWVYMDYKDMPYFEQDEEVKLFTST
ncbi:hypothetical protein DH2020_041347 [Rehmannia glutinosa]|uniref:Uncharacterized protein n=1 Tax=Rehmannia glutinosa TaxID=99300 RepID=A0ABR0UQG5_REHGL